MEQEFGFAGALHWFSGKTKEGKMFSLVYGFRCSFNLTLSLTIGTVVPFASSLHGSRVFASDLRGGVSLVLAGLAAEGTTEINNIAHIDRGYENIDRKLQHLGVDIQRLTPVACPL